MDFSSRMFLLILFNADGNGCSVFDGKVTELAPEFSNHLAVFLHPRFVLCHLVKFLVDNFFRNNFVLSAIST